MFRNVSQFGNIQTNVIDTCGGVFLSVVVSLQFDKNSTKTRVLSAVCDKTNCPNCVQILFHEIIREKYYWMVPQNIQ